MDSSIDVTECLQRWKEGDESAGEDLVRLLYPHISRIVRLHLPRRDDEEDLIQEVLMKMFSRLDQYHGEAPLTHWISRMALNTCRDRLRAQKVRPELRRADLSIEAAGIFDSISLEGAAGDAAAFGARDLVERILSVLPAEDRSLVLLADLEGHTVEEISGLTGWGLSKIKMRLVRIRARLRETIQNLEEQKRS